MIHVSRVFFLNILPLLCLTIPLFLAQLRLLTKVQSQKKLTLLVLFDFSYPALLVRPLLLISSRPRIPIYERPNTFTLLDLLQNAQEQKHVFHSSVMPTTTSQSRASSDLIHLPTSTPSKRPFLPNIDRLICDRIQQITVFAVAVQGYHDTMTGHSESAKISSPRWCFCSFHQLRVSCLVSFSFTYPHIYRCRWLCRCWWLRVISVRWSRTTETGTQRKGERGPTRANSLVRTF